MDQEAKPPLGSRHFAVLRTLGSRSTGLDRDICPSAMPALVDHGFVIPRTKGKPGWVLSSTGRARLERLGREHPAGAALPHERARAGELPIAPVTGGGWRSRAAPWLPGDSEDYEG